MALGFAQAATGAADTSLPPTGEVKCPQWIPVKFLPLKCPPRCGHFIYIPRGSSKCPHGTAANLRPRQAARAYRRGPNP